MICQRYIDSTNPSTLIEPNHLPLRLPDPDESDPEESPPSVRKLVRVDGSATLSAICDDEDDDDDDDDDHFGIDGAEQVDEEEAVQVRSFGRSFGQVRLATSISPPTLSPQPHQKLPFRSKQRFDPPIVSTPPHLWQKDSALCIGSACDSADLEANDPNPDDHHPAPPDISLLDRSPHHSLHQSHIPDRNCIASDPKHNQLHQHDIVDSEQNAEHWPRHFPHDICAAEKRKSRLVLPFSRRSSAVGSSRNGDTNSTTAPESGGVVSALLCFPSRRATFRAPCLLRERHRDPEAAINRADATTNSRTARAPSARPSQPHGTQPVLLSSSSRDAPHISSTTTTTTTPSDCQSRKEIDKCPDSCNHGTNRKKMVKNISLQRDDWIEFTTSSNSGPRKTAWIVRLLSSGPLDMTISRSRFDQENDDEDDDDFENTCEARQWEGAPSKHNQLEPTRAQGSSGHVRSSVSNYFSPTSVNGETDEAASVSSRRSGRRLWRLWPRRT